MTLPYCSFENENTWRWITDQGMFQASITNYYGSFALTFHRWHGTKYSPGWERLHYFEQDGPKAKALFCRAIEIGIEAFLVENSINTYLPTHIEDRTLLPDSKSVIRNVRKKKYKFIWKMNWGTPYKATCAIPLKHWCGATIRVEEIDSSKYTNPQALPEEIFPCGEVERAWERFNQMIAHPADALMEALL